MLAQNFKAAADLEITDEEYVSLVRVLGMLERGDIPNRLFNMARPGLESDWTHNDCGSPRCIVGWARYTAGKRIFGRLYVYPLGVRRLFAMWLSPQEDFGGPCDPFVATTAHAAIALRSYLTTGEPCWPEALTAEM